MTWLIVAIVIETCAIAILLWIIYDLSRPMPPRNEPSKDETPSPRFPDNRSEP